MFFQKRSVGATEQGILAAVLAEGKTVLNGCACEPEIYWLCHYLTGMGAKIRIRENGCICIEGVEKLEAGDDCIPPDRIVAGTYLMEIPDRPLSPETEGKNIPGFRPLLVCHCSIHIVHPFSITLAEYGFLVSHRAAIRIFAPIPVR